jgi:hypothetical protein
MRYLSVVGDYFRQIHFAEIKSSLRMTCVNVNFTGEAGVFFEIQSQADRFSAIELRNFTCAATISSAPLRALRAV